MEIIDYTIEIAQRYDELIKLVNLRYKHSGWQPLGGAGYNGAVWFQAMVKYKKD